MRTTATVFAVAAYVAAVSAQTQVPEYDSSLEMELTNPTAVDPLERADWCRGQRNTCGLLCGLNPRLNDCDEDTLDWECTCASNDSQPGIQWYTNTVPTYICERLYSECVTSTDVADVQQACADQIQDLCGSNPPPSAPIDDDEDGDDEDAATTTATTTEGPTSTPEPSGDGDANEDVETSTSEDFAAPTLAPGVNGVAAVAAIGLFAALL